jgi:hypothetical protein
MTMNTSEPKRTANNAVKIGLDGYNEIMGCNIQSVIGIGVEQVQRWKRTDNMEADVQQDGCGKGGLAGAPLK